MELLILIGGIYSLFQVGYAIACQIDYRESNKKRYQIMLLNKWEQDIFKSYVQVSDDNSKLFQENLELKEEIKKLKLKMENDNKLYKLQLEQIKVK